MPDCIHCEKRKQKKHRRGLCERCYGDRDIRDQYQPLSKLGIGKRRFIGHPSHDDMTEAELDELIAAQRPTMPAS
jgi:hypothetical protein